MRPFERVRVIDLTHVLAGPYCAYQLGLLGAEVVKVERPGAPDVARRRGAAPALNAVGMGLNYQVQGANKRAVALDLAMDDGRDAFLRLVDRADVLIVNLHPGAMGRLGLGLDTLRARNPKLIHCTISGYGDVGPHNGRGAYDNVIQAASGMMAQTGGSGAPVKTGASVIDYATGMSAAFAIAAALLQRVQTGVGQAIDCAMLDCALSTMAPEIAAERWSGTRMAMTREAGLGTYATADGLLMLGAFNPVQNRRLWGYLGHPDFATIADWEGLWTSADAMRDALARVFMTKSATQWEIELNEIGVPAQRVATLCEAVDSERRMARGFLSVSAGVTVPLAPFRFATGGPRIDTPAPACGEHTREMLVELGFPVNRIESMIAAGAAA